MASCTCGQCGDGLVHIGEHVSQKLSCRPLQFFVRRDVYPQYACRACETIMSLLASTKASGHEPHAWPTDAPDPA